MNISVASTKIIAIAPGELRDMNDEIDMPIGFPNLQGNVNPALKNLNFMPPLYLNSSVNGADGLDTGSLAASSFNLVNRRFTWAITTKAISLYSNAFPVPTVGL